MDAKHPLPQEDGNFKFSDHGQGRMLPGEGARGRGLK